MAYTTSDVSFGNVEKVKNGESFIADYDRFPLFLDVIILVKNQSVASQLVHHSSAKFVCSKYFLVNIKCK